MSRCSCSNSAAAFGPDSVTTYVPIAAREWLWYVHETANLRDHITRHIETAGSVLVRDRLLTSTATPARVVCTVLSDADNLKEARIRKVTELQPWLNLIELPGAA